MTASFSDDLSYITMRCYGPDVPLSYMANKTSGGDYGESIVMENNDHLIENKASVNILHYIVQTIKNFIIYKVKWPVRETGSYSSNEAEIDFLYEMYKPSDFDENQKYPLLIEVYGGPGYQKVRSR